MKAVKIVRLLNQNMKLTFGDRFADEQIQRICAAWMFGQLQCVRCDRQCIQIVEWFDICHDVIEGLLD